MMNRLVLAALLLLSIPSIVAAQTPVDSYQIKYYLAGATLPLQQSDTFAASATVCNQARPVAGATVNPTRAVWDDPANAGRVCIWTGTSGVLGSLPIGSFEATLTALNAAGASAESTRTPFSRLTVPVAPTGFGVSR